MSGEEMAGPQLKYSYTFKMDPRSNVRAKPEELDQRELQAYIDGLLGVDSKRYANTETSQK